MDASGKSVRNMHASSSTFGIDVLIVGNLKNSFNSFHYKYAVDLISICSHCRLNPVVDAGDLRASPSVQYFLYCAVFDKNCSK